MTQRGQRRLLVRGIVRTQKGASGSSDILVKRAERYDPASHEQPSKGQLGRLTPRPQPSNMDVTSLLNASAGARQRRVSVASSTPSATAETTAASTALATPSPEQKPLPGPRSPVAGGRNRSCKGGGYSLPLTIDTKSIPSAASSRRPTLSSDSPADEAHTTSASLNSLGHKYSNSRSSLSSYTSSSTYSGSHSQLSSQSLTGESYPPSLVSDLSFDTGSTKMTDKNKEGKDDALGPSRERTSSGRNSDARRPAAHLPFDLTGDGRPESPSDAVILRRSRPGRSDSSRYVQQLLSLLHARNRLLSCPFSRLHIPFTETWKIFIIFGINSLPRIPLSAFIRARLHMQRHGPFFSPLFVPLHVQKFG